MRKFFLFLSILFATLRFCPKAFSYSLNLCTGLAVEKSFIVSTLDSGISKNEAYSGSLTFTYGLFSNLELNATGNFSVIKGEKEYDTFTFQPRYDFGSNQIAALSLSYDNSGTKSYIISPQYHTIYEPETSPFCFGFNLGFNFYMKEGKENNNAFALLAPVYKVSPNRFQLFLEFAPIYNFQGESKGLSMNLDPGFWMGFDEAKYQLILALLINNIVSSTPDSEVEWGAGVYFSITF